MTTTTTFKTQHEIPMDKITFDTINKHIQSIKHAIENDFSAINRFVILPCTIIYDEDLQIASFNSYDLLSIEPTPDYFIITTDDYGELPNYYFINKKTGEFTKHRHNRQFPYRLLDGLLRVYNQTEHELLEFDFISDELKEWIDDGYDDVFSR